MHLSTIFGYDVIALADSGVTYFCVCKCRFGTKEKLSNSLETVVKTLSGALGLHIDAFLSEEHH